MNGEKMNASFESKVNLIKCKISIKNYINKIHMHCTCTQGNNKKKMSSNCSNILFYVVRVQFSSCYLFRLLSLRTIFFPHSSHYYLKFHWALPALGEIETQSKNMCAQKCIAKGMRAATVNRKWFYLTFSSPCCVS